MKLPHQPSLKPLPRLGEMTKEQWWEACQSARPALTRAQFDRLWVSVDRAKRRRMH